MLYERRIGDARVQNIVEIIGPTHDPARVFPDLTAEQIARHSTWLAPNQYVASINRFIVGIQIWIVHLGDEVIVIDTGVGNARPRGLPRFNMLNTLVPAWLAAAGAGPEQVTHVVNTHLHGDHVGWNTVRADGRDVPYFPNARYWMPERDFHFFREKFIAEKGIGDVEAMADCVLPLVEEGHVTFYGAGDTIVPGLVAESAYGHTPGQMALRLSSGGAEGVFCADIFHSPIQIAEPEINTAYCIEPEQARATRKRFLAESAASGVLVMPCHFGFPHCGYVRPVAGGGYRFEPEAR